MFVQNVTRVRYMTTILYSPKGGTQPMTVDKAVYAASAEEAKLRVRDMLNGEPFGEEMEIISVSAVKKEANADE